MPEQDEQKLDATLAEYFRGSLDSQRGRSEEPWYVGAKDAARNVLVIVQGHDHPRLLSRTSEAIHLHWVSGGAPALPIRCMAKTRYRQADQSCRVSQTGHDRCRVEFDVPQRAVTPGQYAVFYDGEVCLGGGIIAAQATGAAHAGLQAETGQA